MENSVMGTEKFLGEVFPFQRFSSQVATTFTSEDIDFSIDPRAVG